MSEWTQEQADKARALLARGRLSPEKQAALEGKLQAFSSKQAPSGAQSLSEDPELAKAQARAIELMAGGDPAGLRAEPLPQRMESDKEAPFKPPQSAQEFENLRNKKTVRTPAEIEELNRAKMRMHEELYNDDAPTASKLREFDRPAEFTPPAADLMTKLNPTAWDEPSVERFMADMGQTLSPSDREQAKLNPEGLHAYKVYRDKKWAEALAQAQELGVPIVRSAFVPGLLENIQKGNATGAIGNAKSGMNSVAALAKGGRDAYTLGATDWLDRQIDPEANEADKENARAHGLSSGIGTAAGYLAPTGAANTIFSAGKAGLQKALPRALQGGYLEATAAGALTAPVAGAIERGFSADPEQRALDPDRMLIESLLGGGFGLAGHALGALPAKGAKVIERDNPLLETGEQRLGIRLGPLGGVHLPPAARAAEAERLAMPIDSRPGSATEMLVDRIRPKYAEAGLRETEGLKGKLEQETGAYFASPEGQARVPVDKTIEAARRRFDALMDDEARVMPGQEGSADLARQMEDKLESFGGGTMNAKQLDEFIGWVDDQANAATKRGAKDPLLDDFMRAAREDRQQFAANEVTDLAVTGKRGGTTTEDAQWPVQEVEPGGIPATVPTPEEADRYFGAAVPRSVVPEDQVSAVENFTFRYDQPIRQLERGVPEEEVFRGMVQRFEEKYKRPLTPGKESQLREQLQIAKDSIPKLREFFDKTPPTTEIPVVYRGLAVDEDVAKKFLNDPEVVMDATTSSSWDPVIAEDFANTVYTKRRLADPGASPVTVMLKLRHKSGRAVTDLSAFGGQNNTSLREGTSDAVRHGRMSSEKEVLLPPGSRYRVVRRYKAPSEDPTATQVIVEAEEVGDPVTRYLPRSDAQATLSDGTKVSGLAAMKAKQETQLSALDRDLANAGLPREFRGREPGFSGQPGEVRLDPKTEVPQLNNALKNAYKPAASGDQRRAVEGFAKKAGVYDDLRALGATQVGEELRNMGRLFGATTHSGTRYGRIANTALPWLRAMASDGRIPSRVMEFVRNLRAGLNAPGGGSPIARFKGGYNSPLPGPWDFAADPLGTTSMQGLALRGGAPSKFRPGIEAASDPFGLKSEQEQVDPTMTEEDVLNLARLIESTREQETRP